MQRTRIEWTNGGYTWNPVTGCRHDCPYCYARRQSWRFAQRVETTTILRGKRCETGGVMHVLDVDDVVGKSWDSCYPYGFAPTYHKYRLKDPQTVKRPSTVFVCSMADLFGAWVPDEWIKAVFDVCRKARQHNYLFLTKNPKRYVELNEVSDLFMGDNAWFGTSYTNTADDLLTIEGFNTFVSIEPILEPLPSSALEDLGAYQWVIVGAETGNRKGKVVPKREWIENIITACKAENVPIFMKSNLVGIFDEAELIQQYPWEIAGNERSKP